MEISFFGKIKYIFFNHKGRFSRETFIVTLVTLFLFIAVSSPLLYKLCGLFLPVIVINIMAVVYALYMLYSMFVICIKRLHDLNKTGWISILLLFPVFNVLLIVYLALVKGVSKENNYGIPLNYKGPFGVLFASYVLLFVLCIGTGVGEFFYLKGSKLENNQQGVQGIMNFLPQKMKAVVGDNKGSIGALFIDNQFSTPVAPITENRILVRGVDSKKAVQKALSQGKKVEIRLLNDSTASVTKFIVANDSFLVQMSVFEIDKPIGTPGKLNDENRKILEEMNAF